MSYFLEAKNRKQALAQAPEAGWLVKVCGGYRAFEYYDDYKNWIDNSSAHESKRHLTKN